MCEPAVLFHRAADKYIRSSFNSTSFVYFPFFLRISFFHCWRVRTFFLQFNSSYFPCVWCFPDAPYYLIQFVRSFSLGKNRVLIIVNDSSSSSNLCKSMEKGKLPTQERIEKIDLLCFVWRFSVVWHGVPQ